MDDGFYQAASERPHPRRSRAILKAHPAVRELFGRNPMTAVITACVVVSQTALACTFGKLGWGYWWLSLIVAYCLGAFANHSMYVVIHDAIHNLVFRNRTLNRFVAIAADLPNIAPGAVGFGIYHLKHHSHLGDYEWDADLANQWEARLVGDKWYRKALWLLLFPFFQLTRPPRLKAITMRDRWVLINALCALAYDLTVIHFCGWPGFAYLAFSFFFSIGLHPVGARWIQEHYTLEPDQETFSYYGPINAIALNIGFHNEHHDFPAIPWNRLPQLRALAPEFYDTLRCHTSWSRLLFQFLFDKRYTLFARVQRAPLPS
ncbi:MAG TPA: fatty acid desaturase [Chthoniobacterales bacterium]|nr:fatty acid desaturase [Chthoniobacterales bacterium]